jgi:hypothetical protein
VVGPTKLRRNRDTRQSPLETLARASAHSKGERAHKGERALDVPPDGGYNTRGEIAMPTTASIEARIITTGPPAAADSPAFSPFAWQEPDELVFVAFLRSEEQRAAFLSTLRDTAAHAARDGADAVTLAEEHARLTRTGRSVDALCRVIAWRAGVLKAVFHTYNLRVAYDPYRTSCLIAFSELQALELRANVERATRAIGNDKARVLDAFGLGHYLRQSED